MIATRALRLAALATLSLVAALGTAGAAAAGLATSCTPPCQNAGVCVAPNTCQCPPGFEGPLCEVASCTDDKKTCPDGTALDRVPPGCQFPECPATRPSHFQCYDVGRNSFTPRMVDLVDDFGPGTVKVRRPKLLCAPVNKNNEDPTAPGDADHLVGYEVRRSEPRFEGRRDVVVEDQFGTLVVDLRRPERLLVPSAKSLTDPATPLDLPLVDHYQCYSVRGGRRRVAGVSVEDQFGVGTTNIKKPLRLCLPVDKQGEGILEGAARLMCYQLKAGPRANQKVFVDNQFGNGALQVRRARELCVPITVPPAPACCDPLAEPGQHQNPICLEGHACCPNTGEWACSIGDGVTFICGGQQTTGPFGSTCSP